MIYRPKVLHEIAVVKGAHTISMPNIPYPDSSIKLSSDVTSDGQQTILEVPKSPQEIMIFYNNALVSLGWTKDYQSSYTVNYSKENERITITVTPKDAITSILSIEYSN